MRLASADMAIFEHRFVPPGSDAGTDPTSRLLQIMTGYWATQILRTAAELRIADHLVDAGSTAAELAAAVGTDPENTERFLRGCGAIGLVTSDDEKRFGATELLDLLRSDSPGSLRDLALWGGMDSHWRAWGRLADAVRDGKDQAVEVFGDTVFAHFANDPAEGETFTRAMAAMTRTLGDRLAAIIDPGPARVVVDVGGASGVLSRALLRTRDDLSAVVLDLPHVVPEIEQEARREGMTDRVRAVAGDFLREVPEGDLYLLKHILHDWDDESCVRILANCRRAMRPGGRVLVMEMVLGPVTGPPIAPLFDLNMMVLLPGRERTVAQFATLFDRAGLDFEGSVDTGTSIALLISRATCR